MIDSHCVLSFRSIHHVIKGENILKSAGVRTDMIPNPRGITSDCGMSIKVRCSDIEKIKKMLQDGKETDFEIYKQADGIYTLIEEDGQNGCKDTAD